MGIAFSFLPFFNACHAEGALQDPFLALGSLDIQESKESIVKFARQYGCRKLEEERTVRSFFEEIYRITDYIDCDMNERANICLDLSHDVDDDLSGRFGTIFDGGTLEHVFNTQRAFANINKMAKVNGTIIHANPLTWFEHAFYNFNPRLFRCLAEANAYELIAEGFHFPYDPFRNGVKESTLFITFQNSAPTENLPVIRNLFAGEWLPANCIYMVAYRKKNNIHFVDPYDMQK